MQQWLSGYRKPRFPCEEQCKWDLPGEKGWTTETGRA
jgi:hypothetical protein